jgi:formylmethanofuran dehydrogenase subunit E
LGNLDVLVLGRRKAESRLILTDRMHTMRIRVGKYVPQEDRNMTQRNEITYEDVVRFHGHSCPGLAFGYRAARLAMRELDLGRSRGEELVAITENDSCAVDAIQAVTGCTFGKGNLIFRDYGKQVYTFIKRPSGDALRIAVKWDGLPETAEQAATWKRFTSGDRSAEVVRAIQARKGAKTRAILQAEDNELFELRRSVESLPERAQVRPSVRCEVCGEKTMETKIRHVEGKAVCIPCAGRIPD